MVILMQYKEQIMVDEIRRIMSEITGRDFSNINENISLFSSAIGTKARDILCLFLEIEKRYGETEEELNDFYKNVHKL